MRIGDSEVEAGAVAQIAQHLADAVPKALAQRLWNAYDKESEQVGLFANERMVLLVVLRDAPPELTELRDVLQTETGGQPEALG